MSVNVPFTNQVSLPLNLAKNISVRMMIMCQIIRTFDFFFFCH
jgi:hypothetical protein